ncbi:MAG: LCP family protein [Actinobacteria bacterium]|nr:LCP family protein [Actinomycetota bacterium]
MTDVPEGIWGPTVNGGSSRLRRIGLVAAVAVGVLVVIAVTVGASLFTVAESNLDRVDLPALAERTSEREPMNVLVVGSDSREGLSDAEIERYNLGGFDGQRSDTVILVSVTSDRDHVSVVSFPRDLLVLDGGERRKLTETFAGGPDHVVDVLQQNTGVPIHHYVEVSILGFISVVDAVDNVEICLERPLRDRKAGADFGAGCHAMGPAEALSYVRSRSTARGDFDRMERQQIFMRAMLDRLVATRMLVDLPRLFRVVERTAENVTTDSGLGVGDMRRLARELRGLASGRIPMTTVPGYTAQIESKSYVVPYEPGARSLYGALQDGRPIDPRGSSDQHEDVQVALWQAGLADGADAIERTLFWAGFPVDPVGDGPPVERTTVYVTGDQEHAEWVAAILGAELATSLPDGIEPPDADVLVVTGQDAAAAAETRRKP